MRLSRLLALSVLVALFATAPNAVAKVCHPKKPITCHAASFSAVAAPAAAVAATPAKVKATSAKRHTPAKIDQAMVCGPWVRWMCTAQPLI